MSESELELYRRNLAHLEATGLYDRADEHDACGVGLICTLDGDRPALQRMSRECQKRIREHYMLARMARDFKALYQTL